MSNISSLIPTLSFAFSHGPAFIGFVTGGDPTIAASEDFICAMAQAGADLIEIGIPFSDPIAEGPVIQGANLRALKAGTTVESIFELVKRVRKKTDVPLVLLTYLNPVFRFGYEDFFERCAQVGVNGIIVPDLPFEEHEELRDCAVTHGIDLISMIAPTSEERIARIAKVATGFIYLVSSMGVTGIRSEITTDLESLVALVRTHTELPIAVGFGINTPEQASAIARYANGVIVGSALVRIIEEHGAKATSYLADYVRSIKQAMD